MAFSETGVPTVDLTNAAADRPLILSNHQLRDLSTAAFPNFEVTWKTSLGVDVTDPDFPTSRLYDNQAHLISKPTGAAATTWYLEFVFDDANDGNADFDTMVLLNHNFGPARFVEVFVANFGNWFGQQEIQEWTNGAPHAILDQRLCSIDLGMTLLPRRFSNVTYCRIKITTGALTPIVPQIGEVLLGRRCQLYRKPLPPFSMETTSSSTTTFDSDAGITTRYVYNRGRALREPSFLTYGSDEIQQFRDWWSQSQEGTQPFLWWDQPNTDPTSPIWVDVQSPVFPFLQSPGADETQRGAMSLIEKAPFFSRE